MRRRSGKASSRSRVLGRSYGGMVDGGSKVGAPASSKRPWELRWGRAAMEGDVWGPRRGTRGWRRCEHRPAAQQERPAARRNPSSSPICVWVGTGWGKIGTGWDLGEICEGVGHLYSSGIYTVNMRNSGGISLWEGSQATGSYREVPPEGLDGL
jgi:hypothetical protein